MNRKFLISILMVILCCNLLSAKSVVSKKDDIADKEHDGFVQLSSFNLEIMQFGLKRPGWGFSYDFERYLGGHMSVVGTVGHSSFFGNWFSFDDFVTTLTTGANFRCYPFRDSLRGPYVGFGAGSDVMFYFGHNDLPKDTQKVFFYAKPELGWKFYILNHFMIDVHADYKWQTVKEKETLPAYYVSYLDNGFHLGIGFKFFWAK